MHLALFQFSYCLLLLLLAHFPWSTQGLGLRTSILSHGSDPASLLYEDVLYRDGLGIDTSGESLQTPASWPPSVPSVAAQIFGDLMQPIEPVLPEANAVTPVVGEVAQTSQPVPIEASVAPPVVSSGMPSWQPIIGAMAVNVGGQPVFSASTPPTLPLSEADETAHPLELPPDMYPGAPERNDELTGVDPSVASPLEPEANEPAHPLELPPDMYPGAPERNDEPIDVDPSAASPLEPESDESSAYVRAGDASGDAPPKTTVWVHAIARSGSSTVLSMVRVAFANEAGTSNDHTFALFEPCHDGDEVGLGLGDPTCKNVLRHISSCNFTGVRKLWGWDNAHSLTRHSQLGVDASDACAQASLNTFKTVSPAASLWDGISLLASDPNMYILDVVRDPRAVFASWKSLGSDIIGSNVDGANATHLRAICDRFAGELTVKHPRLRRMVFEELIDDPGKQMQEAYAFLGLTFGAAQKAWLSRTFDAQCDQSSRYDDCRANSTAVLQKWRLMLTAEERKAFLSYAPCTDVASHYGFAVDE